MYKYSGRSKDLSGLLLNMKMKTTFIWVLLLFFVHLNGQKEDYQWPMGYGQSVSAQFGLSIIDFNGGQVSIEPAVPTPYEFGDAGSSICDESGKLAFLNNGCVVVDSDLNLLENGDGLNPGNYRDLYCDENYPTFDASITFKSRQSDSIYFIVHKDVGIATYPVISRYLYLTIVVKVNNQYRVKDKNIILRGTDLSPARVLGIKAQGRPGWWLIESNDMNSDEFYTYYVDEDTVVGPTIHSIGPVKNQIDMDSGQLSFSPDGNVFGQIHEIYGIMLFDFDRNAGTLSNYRNIVIPRSKSPTTRISGLGFSPNSRFAYVTNGEDIYQVDLFDDDLSSAVVLLGQTIGLVDDSGWPVFSGDVQLGPDCRIYIAPKSTANYLHVIHHPNRKGLACELEIKGLRLPTNVAGAFHKIPLHRMDTGHPICDSTIAWVTTSTQELQFNVNPVNIFPNPAGEFVCVNIENEKFLTHRLEIFDPQGKLQLSKWIRSNERDCLSVSSLADGAYFIVFRSEVGEILEQRRLVVARN